MLTLGERALSGDRHSTGVAAGESHRLGGCSMVSLALGLCSLGPNGPLTLGCGRDVGFRGGGERWVLLAEALGTASVMGDAVAPLTRCGGGGRLIQACETPGYSLAAADATQGFVGANAALGGMIRLIVGFVVIVAAGWGDSFLPGGKWGVHSGPGWRAKR